MMQIFGIINVLAARRSVLNRMPLQNTVVMRLVEGRDEVKVGDDWLHIQQYGGDMIFYFFGDQSDVVHTSLRSVL